MQLDMPLQASVIVPPLVPRLQQVANHVGVPSLSLCQIYLGQRHTLTLLFELATRWHDLRPCSHQWSMPSSISLTTLTG